MLKRLVLLGAAIAVLLLVAAPALAQMPMTPSGLHTSPAQPKTASSPTPEATTQPNKPVEQHRPYNPDTIANQLNRQELRYGAVPPPVARSYPPPGFPPPSWPTWGYAPYPHR